MTPTSSTSQVPEENRRTQNTQIEGSPHNSAANVMESSTSTMIRRSANSNSTVALIPETTAPQPGPGSDTDSWLARSIYSQLSLTNNENVASTNVASDSASPESTSTVLDYYSTSPSHPPCFYQYQCLCSIHTGDIALAATLLEATNNVFFIFRVPASGSK
jgi:hypothetical protein